VTDARVKPAHDVFSSFVMAGLDPAISLEGKGASMAIY
jgi:hypothetical protein